MLYKELLEMNIPKILVRLIQLTMESVKCYGGVDGDLSDAFLTNSSLRQGDSLACLLFNFALEGAIRASGIQVGGTIFNHTAQLLGYADDIDVVGKTFGATSSAFVDLQREAGQFGLQVNQSKIKYMTTAKGGVPDHIEVNGC
uniref:Retrovirus-related Pol polyprotein from type-2 retrotransposable element R2DM n=1 Tax=Lygus hesperus TaxID=30085 RepID=A0A0A9ZD00_LYGHE